MLLSLFFALFPDIVMFLRCIQVWLWLEKDWSMGLRQLYRYSQMQNSHFLCKFFLMLYLHALCMLVFRSGLFHHSVIKVIYLFIFVSAVLIMFFGRKDERVRRGLHFCLSVVLNLSFVLLFVYNNVFIVEKLDCHVKMQLCMHNLK